MKIKANKFLRKLNFHCVRLLSNLTWQIYYLILKINLRSTNRFTQNFKRSLVVKTKLSKEANDELISTIFQNKKVSKRADDYPRGYLYDPGVIEKLDKTNGQEIESYRPIGPTGKKALVDAINEIEEYLYDAFQSNWRIVNARAWSLSPEMGKFNAQQWHSDGYTKCMLKVMIYVSGAGEEYGGTEIQHLDGKTELIEGERGTLLLFNPTLLLHRGVAPTKYKRDVIELTFAPSKRTLKALLHTTFNGRYPAFPWTK